MATKKTKKTVNWNKITGCCAFVAILLAGIIFTVSGFFKLFNGSVNFGILNTVATLLLVIAVIIPGWRFSRGMPMWVKIVFWVFAILLICFGAVSFNI